MDKGAQGASRSVRAENKKAADGWESLVINAKNPKILSSRDLRPTFFMCGKGHSFWLEALNKIDAEYIFVFLMDCHSRTSNTHVHRENEVLVNRPAESCWLLLKLSLCVVYWVGWGVGGWGLGGGMGVETLLHSTAQASWLETHCIANNGFLFNFPSAGTVDMSYLTLRCISTAGRAHDQ